MVSSFALLTAHETTFGRGASGLGEAVTIYECSACSHSYTSVLVTLEIRLLSPVHSTMPYVSASGVFGCPVLYVSLLIN